MSEETAVAVSSAAPTVETIELPRSGTSEYAQWRVDGTLPDPKPKAEESAPSDTEKDPTADSGESPAPRKQEIDKGKAKSEKRWQELLEERKQLKAELEALKAPKPADQPKPQQAQQPPQNYQEWRKTFNATQWSERFGKDNPSASYEDITAAMADYLGDVREQFRSAEQRQRQEQAEVAAKVQAAKSRYENFDQISKPFVKSFVEDMAIPMAVKVMVSESEVLPDLVFTIASDAADAAEFVNLSKTNPGKALRYIARVEGLIQEELSKGSASAVARDGNGQFVKPKPEPTPAKRGPESAPEPPLAVGHRGAGSMDEAERALSAIGRGDSNAVRSWLRAENAKELRRRRGA